MTTIELLQAALVAENERLHEEIDRLRAALQWERDNETVLFKEKAALRNATIEECARVADKYFIEGIDIAAEIRALKDKQ